VETMINKAIAKITDEMMKLNHPFVNFIEEHLTSICTNEKVAEKLLNENRTLKEFLEKQESDMKKIAQKSGTGHQSAGMSDTDFYARAEEYYGITEEDKQTKRTAVKSNVIDMSDFL